MKHRMKTRSIRFTETQESYLRKRAILLHKSVSWLVRRAIDAALCLEPTDDPDTPEDNALDI